MLFLVSWQALSAAPSPSGQGMMPVDKVPVERSGYKLVVCAKITLGT